jgi:NitT/TauT family transport system substrate-binding protein
MPLSRARALAALAAATAALPTRVRAQAVPVIRFGSSPLGETYQLPYYAREMGFFKAAGLNVEIQDFTTAGAIATALAGNALDVATVDPVAVANAYNRGVPWAFFAGGGAYSSDSPTTVLCVALNSTVRTAKQLEDHAVGVIALSSISALGVKAWIEANGADLSKIKLFELSYPTMVPALNRGDLAAAFIAEPFYSQIKKDVRPFANAYDGIAKNFLIAATFSTKTWLAQNAATAKRLAQVLDDTVAWANTHHDESAAIVSKGTKIPIETVRVMTRTRYATLSPTLLQPVLDAGVRYKSIEKAVSAVDLIARAPA